MSETPDPDEIPTDYYEEMTDEEREELDRLGSSNA
jgi:hypothetical protein